MKLFLLVICFFMALLTFVPEATEPKNKKKAPPPSKRRQKQSSSSKKQQNPPSSSSSSWDQIKNLLTCKQIEGSRVHDPSKNHNIVNGGAGAAAAGYSKLGSSCSSICSFRDVVHGNTRVVHRADNSPESSSLGQETGLLGRKHVTRSSTRSSSSRSNATGTGAAYNTTSASSSSSRGMQFRKLSGCYECHMIVDPSSAERSSPRWIVWNITKQFAMLYKGKRGRTKVVRMKGKMRGEDERKV
ncbi:Lactate/malate dehydrogenase family protein [Prunus dulcis]|uniref:Lactate/malate dehydrogenase family protein n=1 Tax=Prunus dulcis TaxID=3755 RepID=A0A4Y1QSK1_PRUDU|nr:Lactate/malate dehydrogenase family protein [Prunus dulcis]